MATLFGALKMTPKKVFQIHRSLKPVFFGGLLVGEHC